MSYKESLFRHNIETIKPTISCKTELDFMNTLSKNPPRELQANPLWKDIVPIHARHSTGIAASIREYFVKLQAKSETGRRINYSHICSQKILANPDIVESMGGRMGGYRLQDQLEPRYELSTYASAYKFLTEIQSIYEDCKIYLKDGENVFKVKDIEELVAVTNQNNIRAWQREDAPRY